MHLSDCIVMLLSNNALESPDATCRLVITHTCRLVITCTCRCTCTGDHMHLSVGDHMHGW